MFDYLDFIVKLIILTASAFGLWLLFGPSITRLFRERNRIKKILKSARAEKSAKDENPVIIHINTMLNAVYKNQFKNGAEFLIITCLALFLFGFLLLLSTGNILTALVISLALAVLPYLYLRVRLRSVRIESSYEGDSLVTNLINAYKQNYRNMLEAVDIAAKSATVGSFSRTSLLKLSLKLKEYRTEEELDEAVRQFVFSYDTEWAVLLGMNIKTAVFDGTDVSASMEDILKELKEVREQVENNKRYNNEAFTMIRFVLVPLYLLTVYVAVGMFGFTLKKFINYQFLNPTGLRFFIITALCIIFCFVVLLLAKRPKYDN